MPGAHPRGLGSQHKERERDLDTIKELNQALDDGQVGAEAGALR